MNPNSGSGPYIVSASFTDKESFTSSAYALRVNVQTDVGTCATVCGVGGLIPTASTDLLATGIYTRTQAVPAGSCLSVSLSIVRTSDDVVVSCQSVYVDNVAL